eukprot:gnl/Trimastix_PCT/4190.p1 GENE.gnl/Trimastix_PCT/4190~~gnl/Trimastix_PCT/4190.p1  ORF type:complete len:1205 (-),score=275.23 gnl/Trimastix_PCT/4190:157-3771(-)
MKRQRKSTASGSSKTKARLTAAEPDSPEFLPSSRDILPPIFAHLPHPASPPFAHPGPPFPAGPYPGYFVTPHFPPFPHDPRDFTAYYPEPSTFFQGGYHLPPFPRDDTPPWLPSPDEKQILVDLFEKRRGRVSPHDIERLQSELDVPAPRIQKWFMQHHILLSQNFLKGPPHESRLTKGSPAFPDDIEHFQLPPFHPNTPPHARPNPIPGFSSLFRPYSSPYTYPLPPPYTHPSHVSPGLSPDSSIALSPMPPTPQSSETMVYLPARAGGTRMKLRRTRAREEREKDRDEEEEGEEETEGGERERVAKYLEPCDELGTLEFLKRKVYGCEVILTNLSNVSRQLTCLSQIPAGAVPVQDSNYTLCKDVHLKGHRTAAYSFHFYFPQTGERPYYPAHVSKAGRLLAIAKTGNDTVARDAYRLRVTDKPTTQDTRSWYYTSQLGSDEELLQFLATRAIDRPEVVRLSEIAWRVRRSAALFDKVIATLRARHIYNAVLWSYSLLHASAPADILAEYLLKQASVQGWPEGSFDPLGDLSDCPTLPVDPVAFGTLQHLEYHPLINARVHSLFFRGSGASRTGGDGDDEDIQQCHTSFEYQAVQQRRNPYVSHHHVSFQCQQQRYPPQQQQQCKKPSTFAFGGSKRGRSHAQGGTFGGPLAGLKRARKAHHLIANKALRRHYARFLYSLAHKATTRLTSEDYLGIAYYLLLQGRVDEAEALLRRIAELEASQPDHTVHNHATSGVVSCHACHKLIQRGKRLLCTSCGWTACEECVQGRSPRDLHSCEPDAAMVWLAAPLTVQRDYLEAYLEFSRCSEGAECTASTSTAAFEKARRVCAQYAGYPVPQWRALFEEMQSQLEEIQAAEEGQPPLGAGPLSLLELTSRGEASADEKPATASSSSPLLPPELEVKVAEDSTVVLAYRHLPPAEPQPHAELRFYLMDLETLFSTQPFVEQNTGRALFIDPLVRLRVALPAGQERAEVALPDEVRNCNVFVEAIVQYAAQEGDDCGDSEMGASMATEAEEVNDKANKDKNKDKNKDNGTLLRTLRRSTIHCSHALRLEVDETAGTLRVTHATTHAPLPKAYVKVYAQCATPNPLWVQLHTNPATFQQFQQELGLRPAALLRAVERDQYGASFFHKDGYTDRRGRFDYAALSTKRRAGEHIGRYAVLVHSEEHGSLLREIDARSTASAGAGVSRGVAVMESPFVFGDE